MVLTREFYLLAFVQAHNTMPITLRMKLRELVSLYVKRNPVAVFDHSASNIWNAIDVVKWIEFIRQHLNEDELKLITATFDSYRLCELNHSLYA